MGEGNTEVEVHEAGTVLLLLGVMLGGGMRLLGYAPHALPITCSRRAAVEGREGSGDCDVWQFSHRPRFKTILRLLCRA